MEQRPRSNKRQGRPSRPWLDPNSVTTPALPAVGAGRAGATSRRGSRPAGAEATAAPTAGPTAGRRGRRRLPALSAKLTLALVSLLVLGVTGYSWASLHGIGQNLTVADVIGQGGGDLPEDGSRDILLVGIDSRTDAQGEPLPHDTLMEMNVGEDDGELNTDTIILIHIPNDGSGAYAVSIPRDSYVDVPGFGQHRVNSAYARGKAAERQQLEREADHEPEEIEVSSDHAGARKLIETVENLTGRTIDNYASVNLHGFLEITNAVGGVDVCLNEPVEEEQSGADFEAGVQTISGNDALAFVRQRHGLPRGDLDRVVRQQAFMAGLVNKVLSAGTLTNPDRINSLLGAVGNSVVIDQDWDLLGFGEQMSELSGGEVEFQTMPVESAHMDTLEGSAVQVDPTRIRRFFRELSGVAPPEHDGQHEADVTVNVMNTTAVPGLAADVSARMAENGFIEGDVDDAAPRQQTVVRHAPDEADDAQHVAEALDGPAVAEEDPALAAGEVTVLLGNDYPGNRSSAEAGGRSPQAQEPGDEQPTGDAEDSPGTEPEDEPITADGVTCVN